MMLHNLSASIIKQRREHTYQIDSITLRLVEEVTNPNTDHAY